MPAEIEEPPDESGPIREAERHMKDAVRNCSFIPFHRRTIVAHYDLSRLGDTIGLKSASKEKVHAVFATAKANAEKSCVGLKIDLEETADHEISGFTLRLEKPAEWADAIRYAHDTDGDDALTRLSEPADRLLARIESGELADFVKELSIRHRLRFFGWSSNFDLLVREIRLKRGIEIHIEDKGKKYYQRDHFMRFSIVARHSCDAIPPALNPILPEDLHDPTEHRAFVRWFFQMLVESPFEESNPKNIWYLTTRAELFRCFPSLSDEVDISTIYGLLRVLQPLPYFKVGWSFADESVHWYVVVAPQGSWAETKQALVAELAEATAEQKYGLSPAAASLFEWVRRLDDAAFEYGLTPVIEDAIRNRVLLLTSPWSSENLLTFITLLCEEITELTPYNLRPLEWHLPHSQKATRIRVRKNKGVR